MQIPESILSLTEEEKLRFEGIRQEKREKTVVLLIQVLPVAYHGFKKDGHGSLGHMGRPT